jgi:mannosyltransferase OCH1-like enzyme
MEENNKILTQFTTYMLLFTFGIILLHIFILPLLFPIEIPFYMERIIKYKKDDQILRIDKLDFSGIPANLYQYYDDKTKIDSLFVSKINENVLNCSEFDIYLINDKDARHFINTNFDDKLINIYNNLGYKQKINLWLYCVLYMNGGVYMNINFKLSNTLLDIISDFKSTPIFTKQGNSISNKFIVTKPGEPIFKELIDSYYTDTIKTLTSLVFKNYSDNIKFVVDDKYNIKNIQTNEVCLELIL